MSDSTHPTPEPQAAKRTTNGRFAPGNSGGPCRPRGAVTAAAAALDQAAIEAHHSTEYFKTLMGTMAEFMDGKPIIRRLKQVGA